MSCVWWSMRTFRNVVVLGQLLSFTYAVLLEPYSCRLLRFRRKHSSGLSHDVTAARANERDRKRDCAAERWAGGVVVRWYRTRTSLGWVAFRSASLPSAYVRLLTSSYILSLTRLFQSSLHVNYYLEEVLDAMSCVVLRYLWK